MSETRTYQGQTYQRGGPGEPWVLVPGTQPAMRGVVIRDPNRDTEEARKVEDQEFQRRQIEIAERQAANTAALAQQQITQGSVETADLLQEQETDATKRERKSVAERLKYGNIMEAIRSARAIAMQGGTGMGSLLSALPTTNARSLEAAIAPIKGNLSFDRLQEMRSDPDNKTGGAVGSVTENELALLGSTVASLDTGVSLDQFLASLDRIERHFVASQMGLSGIDPYSEQGMEVFQQYGVKLPEQKGGELTQAGLGADAQGRPIPPEMQAEHQAMLEAWLQAPDPDRYATMRAEIDRKYGFEPDIARYRSWAADVAIPALREGKTIGSSLPPAEEPLQGLDWLMNAATAEPTGIGAFAASMGNAGSLGLPTLMAGQDRMEALRGQSPTASLLGEIGGGITGALMTGGALGMGAKAMGGSGGVAKALATPMTGDIVYGAGYGATQAEDPVYGALAGAGGALLGNKVGGAIAKELPGLVGMGNAIRQVDEAVPTIPQLKEEADQLYTAARASGTQIDPQATADIQQGVRTMLAGEGRVLPDGSLSLEAFPKVKDAVKLLDAYAGQPMTPAQSDAVRKALSDAANSIDASEARLGTKILKDFDAAVQPFVPGFADARAVASRYLNAEDINEAIRLADPRSAQYSQSGLENALRTEFRALDRNAVRGTGRYGDLVTDAIEDVSRGTPVSNAARWFGKFAPRGPVSTGASAGLPFLVGNALGGPAAGIGSGAIVMGAGELGKRVSEGLARRQATVAELLARGGEPYKEALDGVIQRSFERGGSVGAGLMAPAYDPIAELLLSAMGN